MPSNPIEILLDIARRRYPDVDITVNFSNGEFDSEGGLDYGACLMRYPVKSALIQLELNQPLGEVPDTLAHELAHIKTFYENPKVQPHGKEFKAEFSSIAKEYNAMAKDINENDWDGDWGDELLYIRVYTSKRKGKKALNKVNVV